MKKNLLYTVLKMLFIGFICCTTFSAQAQQVDASKNTSNFWQHVRFGGTFGIGFADEFFSGTLAPSAIYEFNPEFALGVALNGTYNSRKDVFKSTILGGSIIGLYNPIPEIQASVEFEEVNVNRKFDDPAFVDENYWQPALFLGVGYRSNNVTFGVRYDMLYDNQKSIYADPFMPFVRVYF